MRQRVQTSSPVFKYYLHDRIAHFRLQLLGSLQEAHVPELTGCWSTARTTLGSRILLLDLVDLKSTDEAGREWLLSMVREGAQCLPETYFRDNLTRSEKTTNQESKNVLAKVGGLFRGRGLDAEPSTRVR